MNTVSVKEISSIWNGSAPALYAALRKVFEIPSLCEFWSPEKLEAFFEDRWGNQDRFGGPAVYFNSKGQPALIITESSGRLIRLFWDKVSKDEAQNMEEEQLGHALSRVDIDFRQESTHAAGEIIAHLRAAGENGYYIVKGDGTVVKVEDYDGPVHAHLGRATFDPKWREKHPQIMGMMQDLYREEDGNSGLLSDEELAKL